MAGRLLLTLLFILALLQQSRAQDFIWTGNGDGTLWSDPTNWDIGAVPLTNGNATGNIHIPNPFEVVIDNQVYFESGTITGGGKILNIGNFHFINASESNNSKIISGIDFTNNGNVYTYKANGISNNDPVMLNDGFHMTSNGFMYIENIGFTTTSPSNPGYIELNGNFSKSGLDTTIIDAEMKLLGSDFEVTEGSLILESKYGNIIIAPIFIVAPNCSLILSGNNAFNSVASSISGNIEGYFEIKSNQGLNPSITTSQIWEMNGIITFGDVSFGGGGTLANRSHIEVKENATVEFQFGRLSNQRHLELKNNSSISLDNTADLFNTQDAEIIFSNNTITGTNQQRFENFGLISLNENSTNQLENIRFINTGEINLENGDFILDDDSIFENQIIPDIIPTIGEVNGYGNFVFPNFQTSQVVNNATFSPSPDISTLNTRNFSQSGLGFLKIDINSITEYDIINNDGLANFEGGFEVQLNYAPSIGDEFEVFRSNTTLSNCNPVSSVTASYDTLDYVFDVICTPDSVILKLVNILNINELNNPYLDFYIVPNPAKDHVVFTISRRKAEQYLNLKIEVYTIFGQKLIEIPFSKINTKLDVSDYPSGVYLINLVSEKKTLSIKKLSVK